LCSRIDLVFELIVSMEFWVSFVIKFLISEIIKLKSMNNLKIILAGVGAFMWGPKCNVTYGNSSSKSIYQDKA